MNSKYILCFRYLSESHVLLGAHTQKKLICKLLLWCSAKPFIVQYLIHRYFCDSIFLSNNISIYVIFNDQSFNDTLTIDIISFKQLGREFLFHASISCNMLCCNYTAMAMIRLWMSRLILVMAVYIHIKETFYILCLLDCAIWFKGVQLLYDFQCVTLFYIVKISVGKFWNIFPRNRVQNKSGIRIFFLFLHENRHCVYSLEVPSEAHLMRNSTHTFSRRNERMYQ